MGKEIFTIAGVMWALVLTGLSVGFGLLKIQGE
uniref:Cytochrome b6-f complex subunit 7 n=2 Tax=Isochrysidaceae TaxID=418951 RepID=A0A3Q8CIA8_9EUKA|nr:PetM [Tisochrysis lutea]YP_009873550.1 cytochrome b6/f complex subunit VII [Isochrysis galbana]AUM82467.1 PetM [Tisochrysis lutea]QKW88433.1 cytochrome b6/f complex subunit VII [Isochrysis galbana]